LHCPIVQVVVNFHPLDFSTQACETPSPPCS
jgi:hypothetical protein